MSDGGGGGPSAGDFQRRQVAVVSFDASGYGILVKNDPIGTVARFETYRDVIRSTVARFGGRTFGAAGDSIMAEFMRPLEAVQSAVEIQAVLSDADAKLPASERLPFRIGVHVGDVIARGEQLYGDDVNIAARVQENADAGGLVITEAVYNHIHGLIDLELEPLGDLELKHTLPVSAYRVRLGSESCIEPPRVFPGPVDVSQPVPGFFGRPAIAVLPLLVPGHAHEFEYLADGLVEDLIEGIGWMRSFPVIDRASSFAFRDARLEPGRIGRALGARYLVSGSFRIRNEELRLTVKLTDAETGALIWSAPYDRPIGQLSQQVPREIVHSIIAALHTHVDGSEERRYRSRPIGDLDAWGLVRRGMWHQNRLTRSDAAEARRLFDMALERDPDSVDALIQLAWWHFWDVWTQRGDTGHLKEVSRLASRALQLDPEDAHAHMLVGIADMMRGNPIGAMEPLREAVRLNPSLSLAHATIGSTHILMGEPSKGIGLLQAGMRLSPRNVYIFHGAGELAIAHLMLGDAESSLQWCAKSLRLRPGYWYPRAIVVAAHVLAGDLAQARLALADLLAKCPSFSERHIEWLPFTERKWNAYLIDGLRMAGYVEPRRKLRSG